MFSGITGETRIVAIFPRYVVFLFVVAGQFYRSDFSVAESNPEFIFRNSTLNMERIFVYAIIVFQIGIVRDFERKQIQVSLSDS